LFLGPAGYGKVDAEAIAAIDTRDAAMGKGDEELFERKMTKEEKKAAAKAAREAKKKAKESKNGGSGKGKSDDDSNNSDDNDKEGGGGGKKTPRSVKSELDMRALEDALQDKGDDVDAKRDAALEWLSSQNIVVTYEAKKGKLHANTRDINVSGVAVHFHGKPLLEDTDLVINYGNRYGFIGPNGSGKSTGMFCMSYFVYIICISPSAVH
jgi:ATP-binding cassette, subfamily F, member 2